MTRVDTLFLACVAVWGGPVGRCATHTRFALLYRARGRIMRARTRARAYARSRGRRARAYASTRVRESRFWLAGWWYGEKGYGAICAAIVHHNAPHHRRASDVCVMCAKRTITPDHHGRAYDERALWCSSHVSDAILTNFCTMAP